jgi:hypothetical protein
LLIFAWSSVSFNLPQVYGPVMGLIGAHDRRADLGRLTPRLARAAHGFCPGRRAGADLAQGMGGMSKAPAGFGMSRRPVCTSMALPPPTFPMKGADHKSPLTNAAVPCAWPARCAGQCGDKVTDWIVALHMARVGGTAWQAMVTLLGAMVAVLSVTGVLIWMKKRQARSRGSRRQMAK